MKILKSDIDAHIFPMGDSALLIRFGEAIDYRLNRCSELLFNNITIDPPKGFLEASYAYASVLIEYDNKSTNYKTLEKQVKKILKNINIDTQEEEKKVITIEVLYGGEYGPDMEYACEKTGLSKREIIRIHTEKTYRVYMTGFLPGFCYLGGLDKRIFLPRLETPRKEIPMGSVGIAGMQTGIYPIKSPGGWRIIGRTFTRIYNPDDPNPFLIKPGDYIRFKDAEIV